jgi:hypothetical protein
MKREENPGGSNILTLAIIGVVGYVGYQYLISSGLWAQWFGGSVAPHPLPPQTQPPSTATTPPGYIPQPVAMPPQPQLPPPQTTPVTSALATQLQAAGAQFMSSTGAQGLNIDQWVFYYQTIKGVTLTGAQVESLILHAGLSDATRGTIIPLATFVNALTGSGLSGIIHVPGQGPIRAPLPTTQNFSGSYGGYGGGGRKGYLN